MKCFLGEVKPGESQASSGEGNIRTPRGDRSLTQSKQDVEHKRKKVETQLADLQSRFNDSERQKAELGDRVSKITVSDGGGCFIKYMYVTVGRTYNMFVTLNILKETVYLTCGSCPGRWN